MHQCSMHLQLILPFLFLGVVSNNNMKLIQFVTIVFCFCHQSPNASTCTQNDDPCGYFQPFYEMALKGHVFQTLKVPSSLYCLEACKHEARCQSFNNVKGKDICELNNRTKEARPEDFISDVTKLYLKKPKNRGRSSKSQFTE